MITTPQLFGDVNIIDSSILKGSFGPKMFFEVISIFIKYTQFLTLLMFCDDLLCSMYKLYVVPYEKNVMHSKILKFLCDLKISNSNFSCKMDVRSLLVLHAVQNIRNDL